MSNKKNNIIATAGSLIGVGLVIGVVVMCDKRLQNEIKNQISAYLDVTKRVLGKYKGVINLVAPKMQDKPTQAQAALESGNTELWETVVNKLENKDLQ